MIDLVGITCSPFRMELAKRFIKECKPAVIKGNGSEIRAIAGAAFHGTGVDVSAADAVTAKDPDTVHSMAHIARKLAEETGAVILVTGEVDIIASPNKDTTYGIYNGSPHMAKVTKRRLHAHLHHRYLSGCDRCSHCLHPRCDHIRLC